MNNQPVSTVIALHKETGIPKPTIVRLLKTLEHGGFVVRAQHGSYFLTSAVGSLARGYHWGPLISEAAAPIADAITERVQWPVAVAVPERDALIVRYTTTSRSPLSFYHAVFGMRLDILQSLSRAYLAFCSEEVQDVMIASALAGMSASERAVQLELLRRELAVVRERGYAFRDPTVRPESSTLGVPIFRGERPVATIGLTWFTSAMTREQAVARYLAILQEAAAAIAARVEGLAGTD